LELERERERRNGRVGDTLQLLCHMYNIRKETHKDSFFGTAEREREGETGESVRCNNTHYCLYTYLLLAMPYV